MDDDLQRLELEFRRRKDELEDIQNAFLSGKTIRIKTML